MQDINASYGDFFNIKRYLHFLSVYKSEMGQVVNVLTREKARTSLIYTVNTIATAGLMMLGARASWAKVFIYFVRNILGPSQYKYVISPV